MSKDGIGRTFRKVSKVLTNRERDDAQQLLDDYKCKSETLIQYLQEQIPLTFWVDLWKYFQVHNDDPRMPKLREKYGYGPKISFRKHVSYYGAVRIPCALYAQLDAHWTCERTGTRYMDCGNWVYAKVFRLCWPNALHSLNISNNETIGDLFEALLGWYFLFPTDNPKAMLVIENIERLCIATFLSRE